MREPYQLARGQAEPTVDPFAGLLIDLLGHLISVVPIPQSRGKAFLLERLVILLDPVHLRHLAGLEVARTLVTVGGLLAVGQ